MSDPKARTAVTLSVNEIEASAALQIRVGRLIPTVVAGYAEALDRGANFPPLVVFAEKGSHRYLLADGFYRLAALKAFGIEEVACELHEGGLREALLYAVGANDTHGLPRNDRDKRHAVAIVLRDTEWCEWNNSEIARRCRISEKLVRTVRGELEEAGEIEPQETVKEIRDGEVRERKATKGSSSRTNKSVSATKSTPLPNRPKPKSQDEVDREEFDAALIAINTQVHDSHEKARRWYSVMRKQEAMKAIAYLQGFVAGCEEIEKRDAA